jgi:ATP-dependent helicase HrpA
MSLLYKPLGSWADLKDDLLSAAVNRALFTGNEDIRGRDVFINKAQDGWKRLSAAARELNTIAYEILVEYGKVQVALERDYPPMLLAPVDEMRDQLRRLVPKTVLSTTPPEWLQHLPRYTKAIHIRLNKLMNAGLSRDMEIAAMIRPLSQAYSERRKSHAARGLIDPELNTLWWMIQELRVSLFAQELKAVIPISVQRVERQLAVVQV